MAALIEDYPNTLPRQQRGEHDENYYAAYYYATMALSEAIHRYPDAPQATLWRWKRAYDLARTGNPDSGKLYAELIAQSLNQQQVKPEDLTGWFHSQEPRLDLSSTLLNAPTGYLSGRLLQIRGPGSAFILILETPSAFQAQALSSDFDFVNSPDYETFASDLTGDGAQEIVIYRATPLGSLDLPLPRVFSLAQVPPQELGFNPVDAPFSIGMDFTVQWVPVTTEQGDIDLQARDTLSPACPLDLKRTYHWDGSWFQPLTTDYQVRPGADTLSFCQSLADHAASVWGPEAGIQVMQTILPDWPPAETVDGKPFPKDGRDEWRYRIGIYHALLGERDAAVKALQEVIDSPSTTDSSWIAPARSFLNNYPSAQDVYRACVKSDLCDAGRALAYVVGTMGRGDFDQALTLLGQAGVSLRASGYFDFDGDKTSEVWFTVRHRPGEKLELWLLVPYTKGVRALQLGELDTNAPTLTYYQDEPLPPVVLINNAQAIRIQRLSDTLEPYVTPVELPKLYPDRFKDGLKAVIKDFFGGQEPGVAQKDLLALQKNPGLLCRSTFSCDEYYYFLGLFSELGGDRTTAINSYLQVWRDNFKSPYATMARLRLNAVVGTPTATITPAITLTPTSIPPGTQVTLAPTMTLPPGTLIAPTPTASTTPTVESTPTSETPYPPPTEFITDTPYQ
jgi:hypothetical protein